MIKFHNKNRHKTMKLIAPKTTVAYQEIIKKTDAKLTDIAVHGVKLPGYQKLSLQKRKKKARNLSNSFQQEWQQAECQKSPGLFNNTEIRTRLKSLFVQLTFTNGKSFYDSMDRRQSFHKEVPGPLQEFLKTSAFSYNKSQRYIHTSLICTNKTYKSKRHNIQQSVKCHSNKHKIQNPLWLKQNYLFNDLHLKNDKNVNIFNKSMRKFNDSLLSSNSGYWSLRASEAENTPSQQLRYTKREEVSDKIKEDFKQPQTINPKSKVRYSIKLTKEQKINQNAVEGPAFENANELMPKLEQQQLSDTN